MYIWEHRGVGENRFGEPPAPTTLRMRPQPYLKLDWFEFDKSSLTPRLADMVNKLADTVIQSWNSPQPIEIVRLIGHTDSTGTEKYNVGLGDRRADTVAAVLQEKLKGLSGRTKVVVEKSPGETEPTADNRTAEGQGLNRRVEVFIKTAVVAPPKPKPPINLWDWSKITPPRDPIIRTKPDPHWIPIPPAGAGKSLKDTVMELCEKVFPRPICPSIVNRILSGSCALLEELFQRAGGILSEKQKEDLRQQCRDAAEKRR
jgi:OmpA family